MEGHAPPPEGLAEAIESARFLILLGGPMAVYEADQYPFLDCEISAVRRRIAAGRPTLGFCLGSQILAAAAGARVYSSGRQEIGGYPIVFTPQAAADPVLGKLSDGSNLFFHWHGDTFDLPAGARLIGSSALTPHQGFMLGRHTVALQFHAEVGAQDLDNWLAVYEPDLKPGPGVMTAQEMRSFVREEGESLRHRLLGFYDAWLDELGY
jgi:GMP synthase (glutamine-hydrolysing)